MPTCIFITKPADFSCLTDRWMDEWTDCDSGRTYMHVRSGWRGRREGASVGWFEEQPWLRWVRTPRHSRPAKKCHKGANGWGNRKYHHLRGPEYLTLSDVWHNAFIWTVCHILPLRAVILVLQLLYVKPTPPLFAGQKWQLTSGKQLYLPFFK